MANAISAKIHTESLTGKKRGPKPKLKVNIEWSPDFAYAIGLIVSDGSISKDGRHVSFVSKDLEQIKNFLKALKINNYIGLSKGLKDMEAYRVQFSDVYFWNFLNLIGISPSKSKSIGKVSVPQEYFFDFVRGEFDGDGSFYSYVDRRWKGSLMFYISFASGSKDFIGWLQYEIYSRLDIKDHITKPSGRNTAYQLRYAKQESLLLLKRMYEKADSISLSCKRLKIKKILGTISTPFQIKV